MLCRCRVGSSARTSMRRITCSISGIQHVGHRADQLQRNVHRSQNRIESYHQLRSAIAQVGGVAPHPPERALHLPIFFVLARSRGFEGYVNRKSFKINPSA